MDTEDAVGHIGIKGEFNIYAAAALRQLLLDALNAGSQVEIDLSDVSEMDSAGLQLLIAARREAARQGKPLRFAGGSRAVLDLLDLCALPMILDETGRV